MRLNEAGLPLGVALHAGIALRYLAGQNPVSQGSSS
jgi:hypothetical protein